MEYKIQDGAGYLLVTLKGELPVTIANWIAKEVIGELNAAKDCTY